MGLVDDDQILMENSYVFEGYGAKELTKEFLNKLWRLLGRNKLWKKLQETPHLSLLSSLLLGMLNNIQKFELRFINPNLDSVFRYSLTCI